MSISFDILPGTRPTPSLRAWIARTEALIWARMREHGSSEQPSISVLLRDNRSEELRPIDLDAPAVWGPDEYAFFMLGDEGGGIDASVFENHDHTRAIYRDGFASHDVAEERLPATGSEVLSWFLRPERSDPADRDTFRQIFDWARSLEDRIKHVEDPE